ncbi:DUF3152 domain-containing protein [Melissospora conviva]|uniref:DUF3152 domain-containing protein n=1 Tax=Melissospora conviva TaxID=3388432 RepID=UPI003C19F6D7
MSVRSEQARRRRRRRPRWIAVLAVLLVATVLIRADLRRGEEVVRAAALRSAETPASEAAAPPGPAPVATTDPVCPGAPGCPDPTAGPYPDQAAHPDQAVHPDQPGSGGAGQPGNPQAAVPIVENGYPQAGPATFRYADGKSDVFGAVGKVLTYRVGVEDGAGVTEDDFAAAVDLVLGDEQSWPASGKLRLQRVPGDDKRAGFTVYLATAATSEQMCAEGGLKTEGFTSCRLPGKVIINLSRWQEAVPDYGAPLWVYRTYVINHEVGHELGQGHQGCPGRGKPAPVMQQQTYGLQGCLPNAYPYPQGKRYEGPPVAG